MNTDTSMLTALRHRFRIYCGPTLVDSVANRLSHDYFHVITIGTAHVYIATNCDKEVILKSLNRLAPSWRYNDIEQLA